MSASRLMFVGAAVLAFSLGINVVAEDAEWVSLFDGKTMDGWEKVGNDASVWDVKDGAICGAGPASMLVSTKGPYKNFRYRAEAKINDHGNSGLYFRFGLDHCTDIAMFTSSSSGRTLGLRTNLKFVTISSVAAR